jgi:hypothetical protein
MAKRMMLVNTCDNCGNDATQTKISEHEPSGYDLCEACQATSFFKHYTGVKWRAK